MADLLNFDALKKADNYYRKGDIIKSAERFRKDLINQNDAALKQMSNAYSESVKRLKPQLELITKKIAEAQELGKDISPSWFFRQDRYKELIRQCESELNNFAQYAQDITQDQQTTGKLLGLEHSKILAQNGLPGIVNWNSVPHDALQNVVGFLGDGSPLNTVFEHLAPEVTKGIKEVITSGLAQGWNPRKTARAIEREFGKGLIRTELVVRTETMRAYRTASLENYKANSDIVEGVIWISAESPRTCAACWSMHGKFFKFDEIPADHPSGRCTTAPKTKSWDEIAGHKTGIKDTSAQAFESEQRFEKLSEADQIKILGNTKFEAWKNGDLKLRDIAGTGYSRAYGEQVRIKTLEELGIQYPAVKPKIKTK